QTPDKRLLHCIEYAGHVLVPAGESRARLVDIAAIGPGFIRPRILLDNRDEIDVARAGNKIADEVFAWPHCHLQHNFEIEMPELFGGHQATIGDTAGEARGRSAAKLARHRRADAVPPGPRISRKTHTALEPATDRM